MAIRWTVTPWEAGRLNPDDGCAHDGDQLVGRVMRVHAGPQGGMWQWSMTVQVRRPVDIMPTSGTAASRSAAKAAVEACYARAKQQGIVRYVAWKRP